MLTSIAAAAKSVLNSLFGVDTVTLTQAQMPVHYHSAGIYDPGHAHTIPYYGGQTDNTAAPQGGPAYPVVSTTQMITNPAATGVRVNSSNGIDTTYSSGGGGAHTNLQPSKVVNWIIRLG